MVNPVGPLPPAHFSQYDVELYTYQLRFANPNPHVINSDLPSPFDVAKSQQSAASRKKKQKKESKKDPSNQQSTEKKFKKP